MKYLCQLIDSNKYENPPMPPFIKGGVNEGIPLFDKEGVGEIFK
jgi:hypothetical protein